MATRRHRLSGFYDKLVNRGISGFNLTLDETDRPHWFYYNSGALWHAAPAR
jgi:hypothetical protein